MAALIKAMCVVFIAAVLVATPAEAIGCGNVVSYLSSCLSYVTNRGPIGQCCGGVKGLFTIAKTTADRQTICVCLKTLANSYQGINYGKAAGLPKLCGINIPYKISPSTDCSKVS